MYNVLNRIYKMKNVAQTFFLIWKIYLLYYLLLYYKILNYKLLSCILYERK